MFLWCLYDCWDKSIIGSPASILEIYILEPIACPQVSLGFFLCRLARCYLSTMSSTQSIEKTTAIKAVVSRACLQCRGRHVKCDGAQPVCTRCYKDSKSCTYVKSNRGGSRKRGAKKVKLSSGTEIDMNLPCVKHGYAHLADDPHCTQSCLKEENQGKALPCMTTKEFTDDTVNFHPKFNSSKSKDSIDMIFDVKFQKPFGTYYISPGLVRNLDIGNIVETYYSNFHYIHPFLPEKKDIYAYLSGIPYNYDLLLSMKLMGAGQSTGLYAKDVETVNFLITSILDYMKQVGRDFVALQSLLILSMVAHISSLHDLSVKLREALVDLCLELNLHRLDMNSLPPIFKDVNGFTTESEDSSKNHSSISQLQTPVESIDSPSALQDILSSPRLKTLSGKLDMADTIRKTLWEIYFFDTLSGTASGHTMSKIAIQKVLTFYPLTTPETVFDFKSRAESCKLVNDAIKLNVAIQANLEVESHLSHMKAAISNWEMKMENPDLSKAPYLVNRNGSVNEGVHQAMMLVSYAKIFTHRPFSYLWRPDISKHPRCTDEEGVTDNCEELNKQEMDSRKIIETRKTIDSANSVVKALIDTELSQITKRTPFCACALAFSCLVHLSAYSWVESSLNFIKENKGLLEFSALESNVSSSELATYAEYIKLELNGIYAISRHWALSSKLTTHIRETLLKVSPKLYKIVQSTLPDPSAHTQGVVKIENDFATPSTGMSPIRQDIPDYQPLFSNNNGNNSGNSSGSGHSRSIDTKTPNTLHTGYTSVNGSERDSSLVSSSPNLDYIAKTNLNTINNNDINLYSNDNNNNNNNATSTSATIPDITFNQNLNEIDFNEVFADDVFSPMSDTGCDWVDKHIFEFDEFNFSDIPIMNNNNLQ